MIGARWLEAARRGHQAVRSARRSVRASNVAGSVQHSIYKLGGCRMRGLLALLTAGLLVFVAASANAQYVST